MGFYRRDKKWWVIARRERSCRSRDIPDLLNRLHDLHCLDDPHDLHCLDDPHDLHDLHCLDDPHDLHDLHCTARTDDPHDLLRTHDPHDLYCLPYPPAPSAHTHQRRRP